MRNDDAIVAAVMRNQCTLFLGRMNKWNSANSSVTSCPCLSPQLLFPGARDIEVGASLVAISGPSGESLHFHSSHLIGVVVKGSGVLLSMSPNGDQRADRVSVGDCVVIPRGVLHLFECTGGESMDYVALEVSDSPIDYQKHFVGHPEA